MVTLGECLIFDSEVKILMREDEVIAHQNRGE